MINSKPRGISLNKNALNIRCDQQQLSAPQQQLDNLKAAVEIQQQQQQQQPQQPQQPSMPVLGKSNLLNKVTSNRELLDKLGDKLSKPKIQLPTHRPVTDENAAAGGDQGAVVSRIPKLSLKLSLGPQSRNVLNQLNAGGQPQLQQQAPKTQPLPNSNKQHSTKLLLKVRRDELTSLALAKLPQCQQQQLMEEGDQEVHRVLEQEVVEEEEEEVEEEEVEDIDKSSSRDAIFLVCDIAKDIYEYMYVLEEEQSVRQDYLRDQKILTPKVRQRLVNWCIEINSQLKLLPETLYMTISIIDRFFDQVQVKQQSQVQLVAVGATLIASKYEEIYPPDVGDLMHLTQNSYTRREIMRVEILILEQLNFNLGKPIPPAFLRRFSRAAHCDQKMHTIAKYLMELSLNEYECAHWRPSMLAAAALYASIYLTHPDNQRPILTSLARRNLQPAAVMKERWSKSLAHHSHYTSRQLREPVATLARILKTAHKSPQNYYCVKKNLHLVGKWTELKSTRVDDLIKLADHN